MGGMAVFVQNGHYSWMNQALCGCQFFTALHGFVWFVRGKAATDGAVIAFKQVYNLVLMITAFVAFSITTLPKGDTPQKDAAAFTFFTIVVIFVPICICWYLIAMQRYSDKVGSI
jgi:hypothetical protein